MDNSKLASPAPSVGSRATNPTASEGQSSYIAAQPGTSPLEGQLTPSRMDIIRESLADRGLSDDAITIISASWSSGTDKQYNSAWKKWCGWCEQRKIDLLQVSVDEVVNFLSQSFAEGKSYSTVNTYRSALSSTLYSVNNVAVGSHPLVVRLLKGIYHLRTPLPRYSSTWDVAKVTSYLRTLFPLEQLNLKTLAMKTVMLCALSSAQREQTLCTLDLNFKKQSQDCLSFVIAEHLKTSKPSKSLEVKVMSLPEDPSLCTLSTLAEYILPTEKLRSSSKLVISFIRPHKPVTTSTVGRWIKSVLSTAGIDTSVFKAHSVRGASVTNAYIKGVSVVEILRTGDWTNERTFRKYYLREHIVLE